jgi:hypothetical protein
MPEMEIKYAESVGIVTVTLINNEKKNSTP